MFTKYRMYFENIYLCFENEVLWICHWLYREEKSIFPLQTFLSTPFLFLSKTFLKLSIIYKFLFYNFINNLYIFRYSFSITTLEKITFFHGISNASKNFLRHYCSWKFRKTFKIDQWRINLRWICTLLEYAIILQNKFQIYFPRFFLRHPHSISK